MGLWLIVSSSSRYLFSAHYLGQSSCGAGDRCLRAAWSLCRHFRSDMRAAARNSAPYCKSVYCMSISTRVGGFGIFSMRVCRHGACVTKYRKGQRGRNRAIGVQSMTRKFRSELGPRNLLVPPKPEPSPALLERIQSHPKP